MDKNVVSVDLFRYPSIYDAPDAKVHKREGSKKMVPEEYRS
jgi:hypothetical protein